MKKALVVISVSDRVNELNTLLASIKAHRRFDDYDVYLMFQDYLGNSDGIKHRDRYSEIYIEPEKLGCHGARVHLLRRMPRHDIYVNLDDDIILTEHTHYELPILKALEPGTGFVLTNWARTRSLLEAKVPKMRNEFVKQILVYQGGGMVYRDEVANLMRELEPVKATFDTEWPLTAYINGLTNYRFLGSLAVHAVCTTGGMHEFMRDNPAMERMSEFVRYRRAKKQDGSGKSLLLPMDPDVKALARELHRMMKVARGLT